MAPELLYSHFCRVCRYILFYIYVIFYGRIREYLTDGKPVAKKKCFSLSFKQVRVNLPLVGSHLEVLQK